MDDRKRARANHLRRGWGLLWRTLEGALPALARPDDTWACAHLPAAAHPLYLALDVRDRAHAVRVARRLEVLLQRSALGSGRDDTQRADRLLAAALLHDVGKAQRRYNVFERVFVHLYTPSSAQFANFPQAWQRAWKAHRDHPERGAHMLRNAGVAREIAAWVGGHHQPQPEDAWGMLLAEADEGP